MTPLSANPAARERQLANLRRGGATTGGPKSGHRGYAVVAADRLAEREKQLVEALEADAPLREADGSVPPADSVVLRLLATALCRFEDVADYINRRGWEDDDGKVKPAADLERRLAGQVLDLAESLGMSPRARAKIGMDLIRAKVAAQGVEADEEARARAAARFGQTGDQAGVVDVEAEEEP